MNYADYEYWLSAALLVCAMFGMGATLTPRQFLDVLRAPQGILLVLLLQVLVTPLLALLLGRVFQVPREILIGMLVYAALPGGLFSNIITFLGHGNIALSVSATAISSLACLATTTFVLKAFGAAQLPADFSMPAGHILLEIGVCLLLPLAAGMVARRLAPAHAPLISLLCVRASLVLLAAVIVGAISAGRIHPAAYGWRTPLALLLFLALPVYLCYLCGWLLKLCWHDTFAICIEVLTRNAHLGVLLKASLFPSRGGTDDALGDGVLFVVLFAGFTALVIGGMEAFGKRRYWGVYASLRPPGVEPR